MPSNRTVTYIDIGLNSVSEYWLQTVVPNVKEFRSAPAPRTVINAALSVWHLHDFVWHERYPDQNSRGAKFDAFRDELLTKCPELGWLRDIADAGKHKGLGRLPEVKGAEPRRVRIPGCDLLAATGMGGHRTRQAYFLVLNDGTQQEVGPALRTAIEFWRNELKDKNLPSPFA